MKKYLVIVMILLVETIVLAENKTAEIKLSETVISAERYEEVSVMEVPKNITVIRGEDITKRGYKNVEEALVNIPGISISNGNISVRGQVPNMSDKHLVVLVDGVPQNGMDNRAFDLDFIPVEQIEKIEVVPAGGAIMYGGNATAGIINIVTKDNENKKYWGSAGLELGSFNERKYSVNSGVKLNSNLSIDSRYINLDKKGYRDYTKKKNEFGEIGLNYKLSNGNIGLKYIRNEKESNGSGYLTKKQYEENRRQNSVDYKEKTAHNTQDKYILEFNKKLTNNLNSSTVVEYRKREYTYSQPGSKNYSSYKSRVKNTEQLYVNTQFKYMYGDNSSIILGGDYSTATVKEDGYTNFKEQFVYQKDHIETDYKALGSYALNKYKYNDFIFTQGIRFERTEFDENERVYNEKEMIKSTAKTKDKKNNTNYELGLNYLFTEQMSGYISWNKVYRAPNLGEYSSWKTDKKTGLSEKKESQEVDTLEIGLKSLIGNIYLSSSLFYIKGDKEIMYDPYRDDKISGNESGTYYNLNGKTERKGIELASEQYFSKLTLRENFTYMNNEIVDGPYKGNSIPGVSKLIFGLGATYDFTTKFSLNIESNYHGKAYLINDYYNKQDKAKDYMVTNISMNYNFENGISLKAGIDNLFNEIYCEYITYAGKKINYSPSPERTYYGSIEYRF